LELVEYKLGQVQIYRGYIAMDKLFVKVDIFSIARPFAVATGFIGFMIAVVYVVGGIFYDIFITGTVNWETSLKFLLLFPLRLLALIVIPIPFITAGFLVGIIAAFLNNLVVNLVSKS
jgi:hypothetical protein